MSEVPVTFWSQIRKRIVVVSSMERDVRLTFIVGAGTITLAIFFNVFFASTWWPIDIMVAKVPAPTLAFLALGELLVLYLTFTGISRLKGRLRYGFIGALLLPIGYTLYIHGALVTGFAFFAAPIVLGLVAWRADQRAWSEHQRHIAIAALTLASFALIPIYSYAGQPDLPLSLVALQGLLAMFGLLMASIDVAEIVVVGDEAIAHRVFDRVRGTGWRTVIALALIAANFGVAGWLFHIDTEARLQAGFLLGSLAAVLLVPLLWLIVSAARHLSVVPHIAYRALFAIVGAYFIAFEAGVLWAYLQNPPAYNPNQSLYVNEVGVTELTAFVICLIAFLSLGRRSANWFAPLAYALVVGLLLLNIFATRAAAIECITLSIGTFSLLLLAAGRRLPSVRAQYGTLSALVAELNACFIAYTVLQAVMFPVPAHPGEREGFGFWQAAFVLVAIAWDIISSGQVATNKDTPAFPRAARVCLFFAYIISVALFVMLARSTPEIVNPFSGQHTAYAFDSEIIITMGLCFFGAPFFFFVFALRLRAALPAKAAATPGAAAEAAAAR